MSRVFSLGVVDHVMIAHSMAGAYFGPAQQLHGATYTIEAELRTAALNAHHVVMDIGALRALLREVLAALDYSNLDDHPAFPGRTSTTERVAEHVADQLCERVGRLAGEQRLAPGASLRVVARESPVAWAACERPVAPCAP